MRKELLNLNFYFKKGFVLFSFLFLAINTHAQVTGDFRSKAAANGNWSNPLSWEIYNGSSWVDTTLVPGDSANVNVLIQDGTTIHLKKTPAKAINNLNVGTGSSGILNLDSMNINITVNGATVVNTGAELNISTTTTGIRSFTDLTINSGGTWFSGTSNITIKGNLTNNGGVGFTTGTGTVTLSGAAKAINGPISITNISISGTYTNANSLTVAASFAGGGKLTQAANAILTLDGLTNSITTLDATTNVPNTVIYGGTVAQNVKQTTYYDLAVNNTTNVVSLSSGTTTVVDSLNIIALGTLNLNNNTLAMTGALMNNGTVNATSSSSLLTMQGTTAQAINGTLTSAQISSLTINNAAGVSIGSAVQINKAITLTAGNLSCSGTITLGSAGSNAFTYIRANGNITASFTTNYGTGLNNFTYSGTAAPEVIGAELPVTANILTINDSLGVTLGTSVSVTTLNMTSGILNSFPNLVSVTGTTAASVIGGSANAYVKGALSRALPASVVAGTTYTFPVGKNAYQLFELVSPVLNATGTLTVQAYDANSGGTAGFALTALNTNRYWSAIPSPSTIVTTASVRLTEATPGTANTIGQSATLNGTYINKGASIVGQTFLSGSVTPTLGYFVPATAGTLAAGTYQVGNASILTKLCNVAGILNTTTISGNVVFEMQADYDGTAGEILPIVFNKVTTAGGNWNVIIRPAPGVSMRTTSGDPGTGNSLVSISGGAGITVDGRAGGTGSTIGWVFRNKRTASVSGPTFSFSNDAIGNTLTYLQVEGQNITATSGTIAFLTTTGVTGNDSNMISNCNIGDRSDTSGAIISTPANAIYSHGSPIWENDNNIFTNNNIYNFTANGILVAVTTNAGGAGHWTITGNSFYSNLGPATSQNAVNLVQGLFPGNGGNVITGNYIGGSAPHCSGPALKNYGTTSAFYAIYLTVDSTVRSSVQDNTIQNIEIKGGSTSSFAGISVINGAVNIGTVAGNVIDSIDVAGTNGSMGIYISPAAIACVENVANNTIANINLTGTSATETNAGIWADAGLNTITGNTVYNLNAENGNVGTGASSSVVGISSTAGTPNQAISGNTIYSLTNGHSVAAIKITGIHYAGASSGTNVISKNIIHSFSSLTSSNAAQYTGINAASGLATCVNNMISLGLDPAGTAIAATPIMIGISKASTSNMSFYYNSVYIGGSGVGTGLANTYAFKRAGIGSNGDVIFDNIFMNARSNATTGGKQYAMGLDTTLRVSSDFNVLYVTGTGGVLATAGAFDYATLGALQAKNLDLNSVNADPAFMTPDGNANTTDLHINPSAMTAVEGRGSPILSVTTDIDGDVRNVTTPDIGADEGNFTPLAVKQFPVSALQFMVSPNPAHDLATIYFTGTRGGDWTVKVADITGQLLINEVSKVQAGSNLIPIDLKGFAKGIYMITLRAEDGTTQTTRMVVQ